MKSIKLIFLCAFSIINFSLHAQHNAFDVKVIGSGEPVLLFPGFTCTGAVWDELVKELSKTKECHVFTFAGFGNVPAIEKPWLSKIKEDILFYISDENLQNATVIGHSLGGTLGLWLAAQEHAAFNKIIVVDALPSTGALMLPNFNSETIVYDNPYNQRLLEMDEKSFDMMATQMASGMALNQDKRKQIKDWIVMTDRETYVYGYTDLLKLDLRETVANITIPVMILAATQPYGEEMVKATYEEQYKHLKNHSISYAKDSAHFIMYDQPDWLLNQINTALE